MIAKEWRVGVRLLAGGVLMMFAAGNVRSQGVTAGANPVAIQSAIEANRDFDVAGLWRTLKIPAALDTVYASVGAVPPPSATVPFDRCANACRAELTRANVDDDLTDEMILAIYQESKALRFLVFKPAASASGDVQWRFLGHADHDALGQYEPEYRVAFMGKRFFVVSAAGMHGAGMWLRYDRWYEAGGGSLREVLSLPADGLECRDDRSLCRTFGSTVVSSRVGNRGEEMVVSFTSRYWGNAFLFDEKRTEEIPLFNRSQRAVFVRPPKSQNRYEFAPLDSEIATWEMESAFGLETLTCQDFLTSNDENLRRIAGASASEAKSWLARYVGGCPPSSQRTGLLELVTK